jgi:hypothetical protein
MDCHLVRSAWTNADYSISLDATSTFPIRPNGRSDMTGADPLPHMTADQRDRYTAWLDHLARRATGRMKEFLARASDTARDPWSFTQ